MTNPFEIIQNDISEVKTLLLKMIDTDKSELSNKLYTVSEAAELLKVDRQTIQNHIKKGTIKANKVGRRILIQHQELFNSLKEVKSLKYKR